MGMTKRGEAPRIWYGVQGDGRGHASRALTLATALRERGCQVTFFAGNEALDLLGSDPQLVRIPSLGFHRRARKISLFQTLRCNLRHLPELCGTRGPVADIFDRFRQHGSPHLVLSDFEPFLPRWANRHRIPWMSIDHQHALTDTHLPRLGGRLELEGRILSAFVEWLVPSRHRIVSSFHHFRKRSQSHARFVGCFLRPEFAKARSTDDGHACVYLKDPDLLERVAQLATTRPDIRFEIWTDSVIPLPANAVRRAPHPVDFLHSLASCRWLLTTAGNQLLGEALRLEKPILAIPAPGQTEQIYNALALVESGCGDWSHMDALDSGRLDRFLATLPEFLCACRTRNLETDLVDGTEAATNFVMERLDSPG
jgi:uncharacterized protein (TIGR00661 family)